MAFFTCLGYSFLGIILNYSAKGNVANAVSSSGAVAITYLLSGYTIPLMTMPPIFTKIAWFLPNTHFIVPLRDMALLGSTFAHEAHHMVWLIGFSALMFSIATILFLAQRIKHSEQSFPGAKKLFGQVGKNV